MRIQYSYTTVTVKLYGSYNTVIIQLYYSHNTTIKMLHDRYKIVRQLHYSYAAIMYLQFNCNAAIIQL